MNKPKIILGIVAVVTVFFAVFTYQPAWEKISSFRPWSLGLDLAGGTVLTYQIDLSQVGSADKASVAEGLRDVIEKRVNLFGVAEPRVYLQDSGEQKRLTVELAGIKDVKKAIDQIGETPFLEFRTVKEESSTSVAFAPTDLNGRYVVSAQVGRNQNTFSPEIDFSLNDEGAVIFQNLTRENAGKALCLFLDGKPIIPDDINDSCPRVQGEIAGGKAVITGQFTLDRARAIVERFNAGALPAPIVLVNQQTVDGDFGADSLNKALWAGVFGTLLVVIFMLGYYRTLGIFSALALLVYVALTLGLFKLLPVTMTLSGIAGFVLSIGMAVDANILVFERTKEEIKKGKGRAEALEEGFKRAWTSIRDSNISTIITSLVLYFSTSGFVQGFALTLLLGVLMSMFTAITVTRSMLRVFMKNK
jgi:protein-export membrane protein SecD